MNILQRIMTLALCGFAMTAVADKPGYFRSAWNAVQNNPWKSLAGVLTVGTSAAAYKYGMPFNKAAVVVASPNPEVNTVVKTFSWKLPTVEGTKNFFKAIPGAVRNGAVWVGSGLKGLSSKAAEKAVELGTYALENKFKSTAYVVGGAAACYALYKACQFAKKQYHKSLEGRPAQSSWNTYGNVTYWQSLYQPAIDRAIEASETFDMTGPHFKNGTFYFTRPESK